MERLFPYSEMRRLYSNTTLLESDPTISESVVLDAWKEIEPLLDKRCVLQTEQGLFEGIFHKVSGYVGYFFIYKLDGKIKFSVFSPDHLQILKIVPMPVLIANNEIHATEVYDINLKRKFKNLLKSAGIIPSS